MRKDHENKWELVMALAKTDFKLRYHGSVLGYFWAVMRPLLLFVVLNTVFSFVLDLKSFNIPFYSLQLLTGILLFSFFSEGTISGMNSLVSKTQLVTKTYIPRWTIIFASTLNTAFVFFANLIVLALFFMYYGKLPTLGGVLIFSTVSLLLYMLIVSFSLITAPLFTRFRDLAMIWEVLLSVIMYTSPIIYPLAVIPEQFQKFFLLNPIGFIIHHAKSSLVADTFPSGYAVGLFIGGCSIIFAVAIFVFTRLEKKVAEYL